MKVKQEIYGRLNEENVYLFTLENDKHITVRIITYGATVIGVETPDRNGVVKNITVHLNSLEDYLAGHPYLGTIPGRYANRIAAGRFTLDGRDYVLAVNNGPNHLHGGIRGFDKINWNAAILHENADSCAVEFKMTSPDGDEGYPGKLDVSVTYVLTSRNELKILYKAVTDAPTVLNLTNHTYWNLCGFDSGETILKHQLQINALESLEVDDHLIPTGKRIPVSQTWLDFSSFREIGANIPGSYDNTAVPGAGYDFCYILHEEVLQKQPRLAAVAKDPRTGRTLKCWTTEPGIHLYTGNYLEPRWCGFALEAEHFPDSPNHPEFPSTVLRPGEIYTQETTYEFGISENL